MILRYTTVVISLLSVVLVAVVFLLQPQQSFYGYSIPVLLYVTIGFYATMYPHLIYTGEMRSNWILGAYSRWQMVLDQYWTLLPWLIIPTGLVSVIGLFSDVESGFLIKTLFFILGWWLFSLMLNLPSGYYSQDFKTGKRGDNIRKFAKETGQMMMPMGSIPTLAITLFTALVGFVSINYLCMDELTGWISLALPYFFSLGYWIAIYSRVTPFSLQNEAYFTEFLSWFDPKNNSTRTTESLYWLPVGLREAGKTYLILSDRASTLNKWYLVVYLISIIISNMMNSSLLNFILPIVLVLLHQVELLIMHRSHLAAAPYFYQHTGVIKHSLLFILLLQRWLPWFAVTSAIVSNSSLGFFNTTLIYSLLYVLITILFSIVLTTHFYFNLKRLP